MELLTDIHCHLHEPDFADDLDMVLRRARSNGIGQFVCNAGTLSDIEPIIALSGKYDGIIPCFGIHPWFCGDLQDDWLDILSKWLIGYKAGIGEIGLDGWKSGIPSLDRQLPVFRQQLDLARQLNRPAMIHCLRAYDELLHTINKDGAPDAGFLLHAYSGSWTMIEPLTKLGAWFSFSHTTLAPDRKKAHKAIACVPGDRLLLESDSPDLVGPEPLRPFSVRRSDGRFRNEPANISAIIEPIAKIRCTSADLLMVEIRANTRLFLADIFNR